LPLAVHDLHHLVRPARPGSEPAARRRCHGRAALARLPVDHSAAEPARCVRRRDALRHPVLRHVRHAGSAGRQPRRDDRQPDRFRCPPGAELGRCLLAVGCPRGDHRFLHAPPVARQGRAAPRRGAVAMRRPPRERLGRLLLAASAWLGFLFLILPTVLLVPVCYGSRVVCQFPPTSPSLHPYQRYFLDPVWMSATAESLIVAAGAALVAVLAGTCAAYGLARSEFRGKQALVLFLLSP